MGQGIISNCKHWPVTRAAHLPKGSFPDAPTLVINGDWDLATPVTKAREQAARIPNSELVVVPRWGHEAIGSRYGAAMISDFLMKVRPRA
jgi:pimeloyl-ACP methyl ester carboxylesterase